jgi:hypothetical protein
MALPPIWGLGSPTDLGSGAYAAGTVYDWGFGDPVPSGWVGTGSSDLGFGDVAEAAFLAFLLPVQADPTFPDDGGPVVKLGGSWPIQGPYRVQLRDSYTGALYPSSTTGCHSAKPGQGQGCTTNLALSELTFALPVAPPAVYDLVITYGLAFGQSIPTVTKALRIIRRGKTLEAWALRALLPPHYAAGPRSTGLDPLLGA